MSQRNQMYDAGALYFDPVYRQKGTQPDMGGNVNAKPKFTLHRDPTAPYNAPKPYDLNDDGTVTVRIYEPEAQTAVLVGVGLSLPDGPYPMEKQESGYFTVTFPCPRPGLHHYAFDVNGVRKLNVEAPIIYGCGTMINLMEIPYPDADSDYYTLKKVPHGAIRFEHIYSDVCGNYRGCWVYTPPEYDASPDKSYPVLYIQHGGGENEAAWIWTARINYIADNFIVEGRMEPMIIVCSCGFVAREVEPGVFVNQDFNEVMMQDIIPYIDSHFRTKADRWNRAMAGLSMGAGQSRMMVHSHPELFAYLGQFSSGAGFVIKSESGHYGNPIDFSELFSSPEHYNALMKLTFISCGTEDMRHEYTSVQVKEIADQGFNVEYHAYAGGHEWEPWRESLRDFLPRLFR